MPSTEGRLALLRYRCCVSAIQSRTEIGDYLKPLPLLCVSQTSQYKYLRNQEAQYEGLYCEHWWLSGSPS